MTRRVARWLVAGFLLGSVAFARAEDWPQWRGVRRDGTFERPGR